MTTEGIHGYSWPNTTHILFCADEGKTQELMRRMLAAGVVPDAVGIGTYKGGAPEVVYAVSSKQFLELTSPSLPWCITDCIENQESVLKLGHLEAMNHREATLIYLENGSIPSRKEAVRPTTEYLGTWMEVTREEALEAHGYSMFNGHYYTTQNNPPDCEEERKEREVTQMIFDLRTALFKKVGGRSSKDEGRLLKNSWDMLMGKTLPDGRIINMQIIRDAIDA